MKNELDLGEKIQFILKLTCWICRIAYDKKQI